MHDESCRNHGTGSRSTQKNWQRRVVITNARGTIYSLALIPLKMKRALFSHRRMEMGHFHSRVIGFCDVIKKVIDVIAARAISGLIGVGGWTLVSEGFWARNWNFGFFAFLEVGILGHLFNVFNNVLIQIFLIS